MPTPMSPIDRMPTVARGEACEPIVLSGGCYFTNLTGGGIMSNGIMVSVKSTFIKRTTAIQWS